jgi:6-phosphofructokinase
MRLGILTGGGDCPGLNAAIRAVVVHAVRTHDRLVLGFLDGWRGLLDDRVHELDLRAVAGLLPRGGTMLGTSRVDPYREQGGVAAVRAAFERHDLAGLIVCGGEGTLAAAARLSADGLPIVGIPKTIDNDVPGTEYSIGYDTAVTTVTHAIDALHSHAESHDRVIVVEVMGRSVGWIAAAAGLAGGADVTVTPESGMCCEDVCERIRGRQARGRDFSIVVVAEGVTFSPDATAARSRRRCGSTASAARSSAAWASCSPASWRRVSASRRARSHWGTFSGEGRPPRSTASSRHAWGSRPWTSSSRAGSAAWCRWDVARSIRFRSPACSRGRGRRIPHCCKPHACSPADTHRRASRRSANNIRKDSRWRSRWRSTDSDGSGGSCSGPRRPARWTSISSR